MIFFLQNVGWRYKNYEITSVISRLQKLCFYMGAYEFGLIPILITKKAYDPRVPQSDYDCRPYI